MDIKIKYAQIPKRTPSQMGVQNMRASFIKIERKASSNADPK